MAAVPKPGRDSGATIRRPSDFLCLRHCAGLATTVAGFTITPAIHWRPTLLSQR